MVYSIMWRVQLWLWSGLIDVVLGEGDWLRWTGSELVLPYIVMLGRGSRVLI